MEYIRSKNLIFSAIIILVCFINASCKKEYSIENIHITKDPLENFILIPGSPSFIMGSPVTEFGRLNEELSHEVALDPFYISKYELSREKFKLFLLSKDTNYLDNQRKIENYTVNLPLWNETDKHPIVNISWYTAVRYCNWLTKQQIDLGKNDTAYIFNADGSFNRWNTSSKGFRLPTETEWEYACRANTTTTFATGNNITTGQANYNGNFPYNTNPVGNYLQKTVPIDTPNYFENAFSLKQMHGNVTEWCFDWYPNFNYYLGNNGYPTVKQLNPIGPTVGSNRILRGGNWSSGAINIRSASRSATPPAYRSATIGVRIAKSK